MVVASVHSKLRMRPEMTRRMVAAVAQPHTDILGHCTGRIVVGRGRPERVRPRGRVRRLRRARRGRRGQLRPERQDPPKRLRLADRAGCRVAIDTDAHAPGQLDWQQLGGCERAFACGVTPDLVVNTGDADALCAWAGRHRGCRTAAGAGWPRPAPPPPGRGGAACPWATAGPGRRSGRRAAALRATTLGDPGLQLVGAHLGPPGHIRDRDLAGLGVGAGDHGGVGHGGWAQSGCSSSTGATWAPLYLMARPGRSTTNR